MNVTLLTAHPVPDSFSSQLAQAWARGAKEAGATVHHFDATQLRFDPVLRSPDIGVANDEPDLARVREAVLASTHVTWLFPTWWVGPPAAMKGLVDRLLLPGWAYKFEKGQALPKGLLAGRTARFVTTMDAPAPWYWLWQRSAHTGAFENGTLRYVGFSPVKRTVVYTTRRLKPGARAKWLERLAAEGRVDVREARLGLPSPRPSPPRGEGVQAMNVE